MPPDQTLNHSGPRSNLLCLNPVRYAHTSLHVLREPRRRRARLLRGTPVRRYRQNGLRAPFWLLGTQAGQQLSSVQVALGADAVVAGVHHAPQLPHARHAQVLALTPACAITTCSPLSKMSVRNRCQLKIRARRWICAFE